MPYLDLENRLVFECSDCGECFSLQPIKENSNITQVNCPLKEIFEIARYLDTNNFGREKR